jgi:hypothetical protein
MGSEPLTPEAVLASVARDPRLETERERCWVYRELAGWSRGFSRADYERAGGACAAFPFDEFPWH